MVVYIVVNLAVELNPSLTTPEYLSRLTRPSSTRPRLDSTQTRLDSTRLDSTRLDSTRLDSTRLDSTRLDSTRLDSTRLDRTRSTRNDFNGTQACSVFVPSLLRCSPRTMVISSGGFDDEKWQKSRSLFTIHVVLVRWDYSLIDRYIKHKNKNTKKSSDSKRRRSSSTLHDYAMQYNAQRYSL